MFTQGKTVLVTGGGGFVGRHFVEELLRRGARVRIPIHRSPVPPELTGDVECTRADLTRYDDCLACCEGVDYVIHAAGAAGAAGVGAQGIMAGITLNLTLTAHMLRAAWERHVDRILIFGSTTGYPPSPHPVHEEEMWQGEPFPGYFGYGWMRRYLERLGEYVSRESATRVAICRPTAVYGRFDHFDEAQGHVIPSMICRAFRGATPFEVWGSGEDVRDFLHVTDLVSGSLLALERTDAVRPVNLGSGEAATVLDVARQILDAAGRSDCEIVCNASRPSAIPVRRVDLTLARDWLGYVPRVRLADGLRDTVDWYARVFGAGGAEPCASPSS